VAKFEYSWQWAYQDKFAKAGLTALLGSGFDPGVTSVFAMWLKKHKLDTIRTLDILDCNGGDHGQAFATNFNPEINIREVTAPARHWENGDWIETPALTVRQGFDFEAVGPKNMYLMYHEELESLAKFIPEMERARFWMTFGDAYITHLTVLQNVGMTRIDPVMYEGKEVIPLQFLKAVLPEPASLGATTRGKTNIGDIATGHKDGVEKTYYIFNICDHEDAFAETGNQAISYTTGVPAMIGAALLVQGVWGGAGVFNIEQLDPDPFMAMLNTQGLPWQVRELDRPLDF
jgi:saccharopine dehydrogenase (NAD+, L-lysine-forming)